MFMRILLLLSVMALNCFAQTYTYPKNNSEISFTIPSEWIANYEQHFFDARSTDKLEQFILLRFGEGFAIDTAFMFVKGFLGEITSDLELESNYKRAMNDITYHAYQGKAKAYAEYEIEISSYIFYPQEDICYSLIYWYPLSLRERSKTRIKEILYSIEPTTKGEVHE